MDDMAECPLCGGEPIMRIKWIDTRKARYSIGCPKCRLECGEWGSRAKAISVWNKRPSEGEK